MNVAPRFARYDRHNGVVFSRYGSGNLASIHSRLFQYTNGFDSIFGQKAIIKPVSSCSPNHFVIVPQVFLNAAPFQIFRSIVGFVAINMINAVSFALRFAVKSESNHPVHFNFFAGGCSAVIAVNGKATAGNPTRSLNASTCASLIARVSNNIFPNFLHRLVLKLGFSGRPINPNRSICNV